MKISGINHITLSVSDLEKSFSFYKDVLGFKPKLRWEKGAYFLAGDIWLALSLDIDTRREPLKEYSHIAFNIEQPDFEKMASIIRQHAEIFKDNKSEGDSLYFYDPDFHKLEIHCGSLESRLEHYAGKEGYQFL